MLDPEKITSKIKTTSKMKMTSKIKMTLKMKTTSKLKMTLRNEDSKSTTSTTLPEKIVDDISA